MPGSVSAAEKLGAFVSQAEAQMEPGLMTERAAQGLVEDVQGESCIPALAKPS